MPKIKTHRGAAKRFKVTGTGKVHRKHAYLRHILSTKTRKQKRASPSVHVDSSHRRQGDQAPDSILVRAQGRLFHATSKTRLQSRRRTKKFSSWQKASLEAVVANIDRRERPWNEGSSTPIVIVDQKADVPTAVERPNQRRRRSNGPSL